MHLEQENLDHAEGTMKQALMFIPNLLKLLYRLIEEEAISLENKVLLIGTAVYVVSPWDFLPDMIPFLGQIDDLLLMALVLKRILESVDQEVVNKHWDGSEELLELLRKTIDFAMFFLPPRVYQKVFRKANTR
jgi:uncharacterized membrane protein YkvA (DUF1232 family)